MSSFAAAAVGTAVIHGALLTAAVLVTTKPTGALSPAPIERLDVELAAPVVEHEPAMADPAPSHRASAMRIVSPPAAAVAAAPVLTADAVLTETLTTGAADAVVGGFTAEAGTATNVVTDANAKADGVPDGVGIDRSRTAQLIGSSDWSCPFPAEADDDDIDHALVTMRLEIGPSGGVSTIVITSDPGHGFAREARRCALAKHWLPALDRDGGAMSSATVVSVRFDR